MTIYRLDRMFAQRSVAVAGASPREHSVGRKILRNLKAADLPARSISSIRGDRAF
jgi:acetyltransferase